MRTSADNNKWRSHEAQAQTGLLCITTHKCFFKHLQAFLRRPWVFSRALGCGVRRGTACTPRRKFGSRAGSVARALDVQKGEICQVIAESFSAELEPGNGKLTCPPLQHDNNNRFKFSSVLPLRTLLCVCGPLICVCMWS